MKKKLIPFVLTLGLAGITGCMGMLPANQQEVNAMEKKEELTQEKKDFLAKISVNEKKVEEGDLYDWQKELLNQYDYAMEYLEKKYPSYKFTFTDYTPHGKGNSFSTFWFQEDGGKATFELYFNVDNDEKYSCEDNFYSQTLKSSYESALLSMLQKEVPECKAVYSSFTTVQGEKFDEKLTGQEVLEGNDKLTNTTEIYVLEPSQSDAQTIAYKIQAQIEEKKIYGSYYVEVLNEEPQEPENGDSWKEFLKEKGSEVLVLEQKFSNFN